MVVSILVILTLLYVVFRTPRMPKHTESFFKDTRKDELAIAEAHGRLEARIDNLVKEVNMWKDNAAKAEMKYQTELSKNQDIISQKKSSETRLGQITEHLVPFLENFRHDPKNCHFLGQPIDLISFDFDQGEIHFIEVKTGNAQESKRQKMIKNIIKAGKVYYETVRINPKGVIVKRQENTP